MSAKLGQSEKLNEEKSMPLNCDGEENMRTISIVRRTNHSLLDTLKPE